MRESSKGRDKHIIKPLPEATAWPTTMALPLLFLFSLLLQAPSHAQALQNITLGSTLTTQGPNASRISPSGEFAFGFRPSDADASVYLLAVWFDKITSKTAVWYANTNTNTTLPAGSQLQLTPGGVLSLQDPAGTEIWNPRVTNVDHAAMLDTGNFVLYAKDGSIKWQSFEHPTDTILPSQELPKGSVLQSRLMDNDYSAGRFQISVQDDGNLRFYTMAVPSLFRYDPPYWDSKTGGNGSSLVFNTTGSIYYTTSSGGQFNITSETLDSPADFYRRATLDADGVFRQYVYPKKAAQTSGWNAEWKVMDYLPRNFCEAVRVETGSGACGFNSYCRSNTNRSVECKCPINYSFIDNERTYKGCKQDFAPHSCDLDDTESTQQFKLLPMNNINWPFGDYERHSPTGEDSCQRLCLTDCFCVAAVYYGGSCWKKRSPLSNGMEGNIVGSVFIKVPRTNVPGSQLGSNSNTWRKEKRYWIIGSSLLLGGSALVIVFLISILYFGSYRVIRRKKPAQIQSMSPEALPLRAFTYKEIEKATDGFREELGSGASGIVYKGQLEDEFGTGIAVKKIDKMLQESEKEFAIEVQTIGRTFHRNLVRLLGFCAEGKERLLVYELMTNGSLNGFLFCGTSPTWNLRVQVALGVARGLLYLHEECNTQIIHCDIKPQNILLDENLVAKISDFGLAKMLRTNQTQTNTGIRGTRGYVAPEWFKNIGITSKVDIYSFGVILLEIVCCRRNVELETADEEQAILTYWANDCYRSGRLDLLIKGDEEAIFNIKKMERFVAVALWCLQEEPTMRPTMLKVTQMLDGSVTIPTPPDPSSFISSLQ
ncbi:G-type lectin S-receptor-like serine/threonine-protein kinase LECRK2 [Triticum dicoccoides]|uniref:G-type lectin S-receptor-like serine/threonine-protein kinase LECRK2 n=1 Tax=Triticum dicoccoides TaxID=85692 RepID=UPI000E78D8E8|nr:G-type lectin S-receptor-like serine/threonine-protein kinase LECRK2 [Triticum dicoccoides]